VTGLTVAFGGLGLVLVGVDRALGRPMR